MLTTALVAAAPAAVNIAANFLSSPRQSTAERELRKLSQYFKTQASTPYMQTTEGQAQLREVQKADERNRRRTINQGIRAGATDEAKIAGHQAVNEATASATNQVAGQAGIHRNRMLGMHMNALGQAEQLSQQATATWQNQVSAIAGGVSAAAGAWLQSRPTPTPNPKPSEAPAQASAADRRPLFHTRLQGR